MERLPIKLLLIQQKVKGLKGDALKIKFAELTNHKYCILSNVNQKLYGKNFRLGQVVTGVNEERHIKGIIVGFDDFSDNDFYGFEEEYISPAIVLYQEDEQIRWWNPEYILEVSAALSRLKERMEKRIIFD